MQRESGGPTTDGAVAPNGSSAGRGNGELPSGQLPFPPTDFMQRVGHLRADDITAAYAKVGRRIHDHLASMLPADWSFSGRRVLDFGCGAGRVLRHFADQPDCELYGCDLHEPSIRWAQEHLAPRLNVTANSELPPLPYEDEFFDLVFVASVFTHITDAWADWLIELRRVLRPDGWLIASFLGPPMYEALVGDDWDPDRIGMNVFQHHATWDEGGPWVFHSQWWLQRHWGRAFEVTRLETSGFSVDPFTSDGGHGYVVMKPRHEPVTVEDLKRLDPDDPRELAALRDNARVLAARERGHALELGAANGAREQLVERVQALEHSHSASQFGLDRTDWLRDPPPARWPYASTQAAHPDRSLDPFRYEVEIKPEADDCYTRVARLVGADKRVLELGCSTGYMSRFLSERGCTVVGVEIDPVAAERAKDVCERVIEADLDTADLAGLLKGEQFDVIVAGDVLEHLKDPGRVLRELAPLLGRDGYVAASIPNVTHASIRLALLQGRFDYTPLGLLDPTHLRFFSRRGVYELFEGAGYAVLDLDGVVISIERAGIEFDSTAAPAEIRSQLERDPEAAIWQFIVLARPVPDELPDVALAHFHLLHDELMASGRTLKDTANEVERVNAELVQANAGQAELRSLVYGAEAQLVARDEGLAERDQELAQRDQELAQRDQELARLDQELAQLAQQDQHRRASIEAVTAERDAARAETTHVAAHLVQIRGTRIWRLATRYYRLKRRLGRRR